MTNEVVPVIADDRDTPGFRRQRLLSIAHAYGRGSIRGGTVVAAAYRLAAATLRVNGNDSGATELERAAEDAEKYTRRTP